MMTLGGPSEDGGAVTTKVTQARTPAAAGNGATDSREAQTGPRAAGFYLPSKFLSDGVKDQPCPTPTGSPCEWSL